MPHDHADPKLCLTCAARRLAGKPPKPCGDCVLLNVDPLAKVRANFVLPSPLKGLSFASFGDEYGPALKPSRTTSHRSWNSR